MGIITDILKDIPLSAVLRERLVDQEKKMAILEAENAALKTENLALKNENSDLKALIENLRQEIQQTKNIQKEQSHIILLDPIEEEILLLLHSRERTLEEVARLKQLSPNVAKMHLRKLFDHGFATTRQGRDRKLYWHIKELGTEYLIKHRKITQQGVPADG